MDRRIIFLPFAAFFITAVSAETYRIAGVQYVIEGKTTKPALEQTLKIDTSRTFDSHDSFETYVQTLREQLSSCRTFDSTDIQETVSSDTTASPQDGNGTVDIALTVTVHDTKNLIIVPYPSYSSNTGFSVKLKLKDYNFAGTLSPLSASVYYAPDDDTFDLVPDKRVGGDITLVTPFTIFRKDAYLTTSADAAYVINRNSIVCNGSLQFEYEPVTFGAFRWGPYALLSGGRNNAYTEGGYEADAALGQKLSASQILWDGNFRRGYAVSLIQTCSYDFIQSQPYIVCSAEAGQFYPFARTGAVPRAGFTSREFFLYKSGSELLRNAGMYLRGIRDRDIRTDLFLSCNIDFPFTLFTVAVPETSKLSLFNCEVQCSPFIDMALYHNSAPETYFNPKDGSYSFGMDVNVFPARWRSLQVHGSFGFDAVKLLEKCSSDTAARLFNMSWRTGPLFEISAGIGLFY